MNVLFVTWDGPQSTYLESLFLPIFKALECFGLSFYVLQFTWSEQGLVQPLPNFEGSYIRYRKVSVWRKPVSLGSFLTAIWGARSIAAAVRDWKIDIVMPRGILSGLAVLFAKRRHNFDIIFDADGLPADERVDFSGQSNTSLTYRILRDIEAQLVRVSRSVVTRSEAACDILRSRAGAGTSPDKFFVVTNARDEHVFTPLCQSDRDNVRASLGLTEDSPLIIYVGSLGEKYLIVEMLKIFSSIKSRLVDANFLIVTTTPFLAKEALLDFPDCRAAVKVMSAAPVDVPLLIGAADLGLALIKQTFSMKAASAIKVGEYLLCGVPVIVTAGIGDSEKLCKNSVYVLPDLSKKFVDKSVNWFLGDVLKNREKFVQSARAEGLRKYTLDYCVDGYLKAFSVFDKY